MVAGASLPSSNLPSKNTNVSFNTLSDKEVDDYVKRMTKNDKSKKVILGRGNTEPYDSLANSPDSEFSSFNNNDVWNEMANRTNNDWDEIWKVDKEYINNRINKGNDILLANDPSIEYYVDNHITFYQRELDYLFTPVENGGLGLSYEQTSNGLWKVIK